jgi:hypothetical protein
MTRMVEEAHQINVPTRVTAGQVQLARFRVLRDERGGRQTPDPIRRIASVKLPTDRPSGR